VPGPALTGLDDLTPEAYATVRLFLTVKWRGDGFNAPRQFDVGTLPENLFTEISRCLQRIFRKGTLSAQSGRDIGAALWVIF